MAAPSYSYQYFIEYIPGLFGTNGNNRVAKRYKITPKSSYSIAKWWTRALADWPGLMKRLREVKRALFPAELNHKQIRAASGKSTSISMLAETSTMAISSTDVKGKHEIINWHVPFRSGQLWIDPENCNQPEFITYQSNVTINDNKHAHTSPHNGRHKNQCTKKSRKTTGRQRTKQGEFRQVGQSLPIWFWFEPNRPPFPLFFLFFSVFISHDLSFRQCCRLPGFTSHIWNIQMLEITVLKFRRNRSVFSSR